MPTDSSCGHATLARGARGLTLASAFAPVSAVLQSYSQVLSRFGLPGNDGTPR
jgi:hypothetical protein